MTFSNTIAVRNTQAQGEGSLHWAIQEANRLPGHDHIVFTQGASGGTIVRDPLVPFALNFSILESVTITGQNVTILADYLGDDVTTTVTLPDGRSVAGVTDVLASLEDGNRLSDNSQLFSAFGADTHLTLNGLTLIGSASTTRAADFGDGGAIYAEGDVTLNGVIIAGGYARGGSLYDGGGVYAEGDVTMTGGALVGNVADGDGGGIRAAGAVTLTDVMVVENRSENGAGIDGGGAVTVTASTITGNVAQEQGGGIRADGAVTLTDVTIVENRSENGAGINGGGAVTVTASTITGNVAQEQGGGVRSGGPLMIETTTLSDNRAHSGGGAFAFGAVGISGGVIAGNLADDDGGGVAVRGDGPVALTDVTVTDNRATDNGGGLHVDRAGTVTLTGVTLSGNVGEDGGGAYVDAQAVLVSGALVEGNAAQDDGGGLHLEGESGVTIADSRIVGNTAGGFAGGAVADADDRAGGTVTVLRSAIVDNVAAGDGGLSLGENATVRDSLIADNRATLFGGGGAAVGDGALIEDSVVRGNSAIGAEVEGGGGLFFSGDGVMRRVLVADNLAGGPSFAFVTGGGVYQRGFASLLTIEDSAIIGNRVEGGRAQGGGVSALGSLTLRGVTVADNVAISTEPAPNSTRSSDWLAGGGGAHARTLLTIERSTLTGNVASGDFVEGGGALVGPPPGAGVVPTMTVSDSIVAGNVAPANPDLAGDPTTAPVRALIGGDGRAIFAQTAEIAPGVFVGVAADNGGPTPSVALRAGGPAVDAGGAGPATDQRGAPRDGAPDIGAFERLGGAGPERLTGDGAANFLDGAEGDDVLAGLGGADTLVGGEGADWADYNASAVGVQVDLGFNNALGGDAQGDSLHGVENVTATNGADGIWGCEGANVVFGWWGDDWLVGRGGGDALNGGGGRDALFGDAGIDRLNGGADGDSLFGGADGDALGGDGGNDVLDGGAGDDWMWGGSGSDAFVFAAAALQVGGHDRVMDMQDGQPTGNDWLRFDGVRYDQLVWYEQGSSAVVQIVLDQGGSHYVEIMGFTLAQLSDQYYFV